jgi:hypothetical protein
MIINVFFSLCFFSAIAVLFYTYAHHQDRTPSCLMMRKISIWYAYIAAACVVLRIVVHIPIILIPWKMSNINYFQKSLQCLQYLEMVIILSFLTLFSIDYFIFQEQCGSLNTLVGLYLIVNFTLIIILLICYIGTKIQ